MALPESFDLIFFGGTGDLALRKLLPGLYFRHRDSGNTQGWRIFAASRQTLSQEQYLELIGSSCRKFIPAADFDERAWNAFARSIEYLTIDAGEPAGFAALSDKLRDSAQRVRVFYLSTAADLFSSICGQLAVAGLVTPLTRVVLEKPLGRNLLSAAKINEEVGAIFQESQIFRIDHYLGKETVQNLLALRFGNSIFEPLWHRAAVRDVQITLAESVGVEDRGEYYDRYGALRDMVQNHLLQLLCIVAMEPPTTVEADAVRDEKLKVLRALRRFTPESVRSKAIRGQYRAGIGDSARQFHRNLRRAARRDRQLALGARAVLPAHRQTHAGTPVGNRHQLPRRAARYSARNRHRRSQPPGDPPAAGRGH
jgi:glucose-6-phosphate 1-dehydrogenase